METKEWVKPGRRTARPISRRIKQSYYFFYRTKDGKYSPIERYASKEKVFQVVERIKGRKIEVERVFISNSADFIKFLNRKTAINLCSLAKEAKMQCSTIIKLTNGTLNLSQHYACILSPLINSYGYITCVEDLMKGCKDRVSGSVAKTKVKKGD